MVGLIATAQTSLFNFNILSYTVYITGITLFTHTAMVVTAVSPD